MIDEKKLIELIDAEMWYDYKALQALQCIPEYRDIYMARSGVWRKVKQLIEEVLQ